MASLHSQDSWFVRNVKSGPLGKSGDWDVAPVPRGPQRRADVSQVWNEELDPVWKGERPVRDAAQAFKTRMEALLMEFRAQGIL